MSNAVFSTEDDTLVTRFVPVVPFTRWTFENEKIREWVESELSGRVLNPCAGQMKLSHDGTIIRNDLDESIDADHHVDAAELAIMYDESLFDTIIYDPPWSHYQSNLRYEGRHVHKDDVEIDMDAHPIDIDESKKQVGHARLIKDSFDYLLRDGGRVIQFTFHGTCMPARLGYTREKRIVFDPIGEAKSVIASVDRKNGGDES